VFLLSEGRRVNAGSMLTWANEIAVYRNPSFVRADLVSVLRSRLSMSRSLVSRFARRFFFIGALFLFLVSLCRMLLSTGFLYALWMSCLDASSVPVGVREESRCCHLCFGLYGQSRLAVIGTRCRRNG
jgi:hypothetical protein